MSDCAWPKSTDRIDRYYKLMVEFHALADQVADISLLPSLITPSVRKALAADAMVMAWTLSKAGNSWHFEVDCVESALEAELRSFFFSQDLDAIRHVVQIRQSMLIHSKVDSLHMGNSVPRIGNVQVRQLAAVPINSKNHVYGTALIANMQAMRMDQSDLQLVQLVCTELALRLESLALTREIENASRRITHFNLAKDRVIQRFSHELKTPLAVLIASFKLIKKRVIPGSDAHWHAVLTRAQRSLERILLLEYEIEDILREKDEDGHCSPSASGRTGQAHQPDIFEGLRRLD